MSGASPFRPDPDIVGLPGMFTYAPEVNDYLRLTIKADLERHGPAGRCRSCPRTCKLRAGVRGQVLCRQDFEAWAEVHGREPTLADLQPLLNGGDHAPRTD